MATKVIVRNSVAAIAIFGHISVFAVALSLGIFSILRGVDALQTLLMASPVLAVIALSAFSRIMESGHDADEQVSTLYAIVCIVFPVLLIAAIMALFYLFYMQLDGFGLDQLKVSLGAVETFFGVYVGGISKTLFGDNSAR